MKLIIKPNVTVLFVFLFINSTWGQTIKQGVSLVNIGLDYGEHIVGFRNYIKLDKSRTYSRIFEWTNEQMNRPISISLWYPSKKNVESQSALTVLDYMEIFKEEYEWENLPNDQILNWFFYANTPVHQRHLNEKTQAYLDIPENNGKYPVIVYAPSLEASSIENFALCEMLASHGYVVISSPSRGADNQSFNRHPIVNIETQARDIEYLVGEAISLPFVDAQKIGTMGFSFGGLSNVLAQVRNTSIKANVSLDGTIKYLYEEIKKSPFFNIDKVDVPFIHFAQKDIPKQVMEKKGIDPSLANKFHFYDELTNSEAYQLKFHNMTHSYFSTLGVLFETRDTIQDKSDNEIMYSYKLVSLYTLSFLNAYLKNDQKGKQFINNSPAQNGIDNKLITQISKKPGKQTMTFQDFNEAAIKQSYNNLESLLTSFKNQDEKFILHEDRLNNLGLQLIFHPTKSNDGIKVFEFATKIFPNSANLWDSLAEAYLLVGNEKQAIISFEKSLEINPSNINAINRLAELR